MTIISILKSCSFKIILKISHTNGTYYTKAATNAQRRNEYDYFKFIRAAV